MYICIFKMIQISSTIQDFKTVWSEGFWSRTFSISSDSTDFFLLLRQQCLESGNLTGSKHVTPCDTNINIYKPAAKLMPNIPIWSNMPSEKIQYLNCWDCKDSNTLSICRLCFENECLQRCRQFLMLLQAVVSADPFLCRSLLLLGNIGQLDPLLSSIHGC
jgi:hypothetical protein